MSAGRQLLAAALALACAWTLAPASAPPLYDGLGFPDEPYRYVNPPPGYRHTPAPTDAILNSSMSPGYDTLLTQSSRETGPQVAFAISSDDLTGVAGATTVHLSATPLAPSVQPSDGRIWGNVYRFSITTDVGVPRVTVRQDNYFTLRAPNGAQPHVVMELNDGSGWRDLPTDQVGTDVYNVSPPAPGDYAIVILAPGRKPAVTPGQLASSIPGNTSAPPRPGPASSVESDQPVVAGPEGGGTGALPWVLGGCLVALALAVTAIRLGRRKS